ncbi:MAG: ABC transporter substrate-binding protein [Thaumarchaeota archaeon]|nr:ABC transporter substrate-binding protein [Nitrososphaerota archaeon]
MSSDQGKGQESQIENPQRRSFLKYAVAAAAIGGAAVVGGSAYYEYFYLPSQKPASVSASYQPGPFATATLADIVQQQKFDQQNKLNLSWQPFNDVTAQLAALIKGSTDVYLGNFGNAAASAAAGNPIIGFSCWLVPTNAIVAAENAPAQTFADLKGQTIGVFSSPSTSMAVGAALLQKQGESFNPATDVSYAKGPYATLAGELQAGKLQYAELVEPYVTQLVTTGNFRVLAYLSDLGKQLMGRNILIDVWAARQDYAKANPSVLKDVLKSQQAAESYIKSNPDVIRNFLINQSHVTDENVLNALVPRLVDDVQVAQWDSSTMATQQQLLQIFANYGLITQAPTSFLTNAYNP